MVPLPTHTLHPRDEWKWEFPSDKISFGLKRNINTVIFSDMYHSFYVIYWILIMTKEASANDKYVFEIGRIGALELYSKERQDVRTIWSRERTEYYSYIWDREWTHEIYVWQRERLNTKISHWRKKKHRSMEVYLWSRERIEVVELYLRQRVNTWNLCMTKRKTEHKNITLKKEKISIKSRYINQTEKSPHRRDIWQTEMVNWEESFSKEIMNSDQSMVL